MEDIAYAPATPADLPAVRDLLERCGLPTDGGRAVEVSRRVGRERLTVRTGDLHLRAANTVRAVTQIRLVQGRVDGPCNRETRALSAAVALDASCAGFISDPFFPLLQVFPLVHTGPQVVPAGSPAATHVFEASVLELALRSAG